MRIQSQHDYESRGLDAYFTPPEATIALCHIEPLPNYIWEPACGDGAISKILEKYAKNVLSSDIANYDYWKAGWGPNWNFLTTDFKDPAIEAVITNPPFKLAIEFAEKALSIVPYVALLLRTNFLESTSRLGFFRRSPPSRIWISSRRLPMMHRYNWDGPEAPSNTCFAWFIWDKTARQHRIVNWFDWQDYTKAGAVTLRSVPVLNSDEIEL